MTDDRHRLAAEMLAEGHTQAANAEAVGVSPRTIRNWESSGKLTAALSMNGSKPEEAEVNLSEARRRRELALAKKHELELRRREGELVDRAIVRDHLERVGQAARSAPRRLADEAAHLLGCEPRRAASLPEEDATVRDLFEATKGKAAIGSVEDLESLLQELADRQCIRLRHRPTGKPGRPPSPAVEVHPSLRTNVRTIRTIAAPSTNGAGSADSANMDDDQPALREAYFAVLDAWKRAATEYTRHRQEAER